MSMAQLYYRYSTMNAGKSLELMKVAYNYEERGKRVLVLTSAVDDRYGEGMVTSRVGMQREAVMVGDDTDILQIFMEENKKKSIDCVLVDECSHKHILRSRRYAVCRSRWSPYN